MIFWHNICVDFNGIFRHFNNILNNFYDFLTYSIFKVNKCFSVRATLHYEIFQIQKSINFQGFRTNFNNFYH